MVECASHVAVSRELLQLVPCTEDVDANAQVYKERGQDANPYEHVISVNPEFVPVVAHPAP